MTHDDRRSAVYLLQLRDDLDRLADTRWECVAPGVMSLVSAVLAVFTLLGGVIAAGFVLGLIAVGTGAYAVHSERVRRTEQRAIVERIERIEARRVGPAEPEVDS